MKSFLKLSIVLLGMMSTTAFATTSEPEKELKATERKDFTVSKIEFAHVEHFTFVSHEALNIKIISTPFCPKRVNELFFTDKHIDDVGWQSLSYTSQPESKLLKPERITKVPITDKDIIRIRNDS